MLKIKGLTIAYMQARLPAKRALPILNRQRQELQYFRIAHLIPVDIWYARAKGLSPVPTVEDLIESGEVYALLVYSWDKLKGCKGHWPDIWRLCEEHKVRKVCLKEKEDFHYFNEGHFFRTRKWITL